MPDLKELFIKLNEGSVTEDCIDLDCENGYCGKDVNSPGREKCYCYDDFVGINCEQKDQWIASIDHAGFDKISDKLGDVLTAQYVSTFVFLLFFAVLVGIGFYWNTKLNKLVKKTPETPPNSLRVRNRNQGSQKAASPYREILNTFNDSFSAKNHNDALKSWSENADLV